MWKWVRTFSQVETKKPEPERAGREFQGREELSEDSEVERSEWSESRTAQESGRGPGFEYSYVEEYLYKQMDCQLLLPWYLAVIGEIPNE